MHELALSQSILDMVLGRAAQAGMTTVTRVLVEVGEASGVEAESLRFCFEAITRGTPAEGARLVIDVPPALAQCRACGAGFPFPRDFSPCPQCGVPAPRLVSGQSLRVRAFEGE